MSKKKAKTFEVIQRETQSGIVTIVMPRFDIEKPRYNAHQTGHGAHKNAKAYSRTTKHWKEWE